MRKKVGEPHLGWFIKLLFKVWSQFAMRLVARRESITDSPFRALHDIFREVRRVDLIPYQSGERGFIVILDRNASLYFNQDGDHFVYDGFEVGQYGKGGVTLFDNVR